MNNMLEIKNLQVSFGEKQVLKDISFKVKKDRIFGIVGESGAGKSVTMHAITNLLPIKTKINGEIIFNEEVDILSLNSEDRRNFCSKNIAIILQDSINALNPYKKVYRQLMETYLLHHKVSKKEALDRIFEILKEVGMPFSFSDIDKYPYEYSGGMKQRIAIALCLCCDPKLIIADEPTSSLDAINQLKFVDYINKIMEKREIALIYISHNLGLISNLCQDLIIMKEGSILESGSVEEVFGNPKTDYTKTLIKYTRDILVSN